MPSAVPWIHTVDVLFLTQSPPGAFLIIRQPSRRSSGSPDFFQLLMCPLRSQERDKTQWVRHKRVWGDQAWKWPLVSLLLIHWLKLGHMLAPTAREMGKHHVLCAQGEEDMGMLIG